MDPNRPHLQVNYNMYRPPSYLPFMQQPAFQVAPQPAPAFYFMPQQQQPMAPPMPYVMPMVDPRYAVPMQQQQQQQAMPEKKRFKEQPEAPAKKKQKPTPAEDEPAPETQIEMKSVTGHGQVKKFLRGEKTLAVEMLSEGSLGATLQLYGRDHELIVPDGLHVKHAAFGQSWECSIQHAQSETEGFVLITWKVKILPSGQVHERTETVHEAKARKIKGYTISNEVFRRAMELRKDEIQAQLEGELSELRRANLTNQLSMLKPDRFSKGLLMFGLQHKSIQERMRGLLAEREQEKKE